MCGAREGHSQGSGGAVGRREEGAGAHGARTGGRDLRTESCLCCEINVFSVEHGTGYRVGSLLRVLNRELQQTLRHSETTS